MRNLKRALSLALAAIMVLGMMVIGAGAENVYDSFPDKDEIVNKDAVSMLTTLGIINGEDSGKFNPTGDVTRSQMAKMISVIMNKGADNNALYADVASGLSDIGSSWAKGHINFCFTRGIIAGRGDGRFDPEAKVTAAEAAKMLLVAAGYDPAKEGFTGGDWAVNVSAMASKLGIYNNYKQSTMDPLSRDDAALLIYNALDVEMIQKYDGNYPIGFGDYRTILSTMYGVYKIEGVVVANEWAQLQDTDYDAASAEGRTTMSDVRVYASTTENTANREYEDIKGNVNFKVSTTEEMLGKTVTLYAKKTTVLSDSTVLGVFLRDENNTVKTITGTEDEMKDVLKGTGLTADSGTAYYVNYGVVSDEAAAIKSMSFPDKLTDTANRFYSVSGKTNATGVEMTVIDNDNDGKVDYVLYKQETLTQVVATSSAKETTTLNAFNKNKTIDNDKIVTEDTLAEGDLVLAITYGGRYYVSRPEVITGQMDSFSSSKEKQQYIEVDGTKYNPSFIQYAADAANNTYVFNVLECGTNDGVDFDIDYDFILDSNGNVIAYRPSEKGLYNYALILESGYDPGRTNSNPTGEVKVLLPDGTEGTYTLNFGASAQNVGDQFYDGKLTSSQRKTNGIMELKGLLGCSVEDKTASNPKDGSSWNNVTGLGTGFDANGHKYSKNTPYTTDKAAGYVVGYSLNDSKVMTITSIVGKTSAAANGLGSNPTVSGKDTIITNTLADDYNSGAGRITYGSSRLAVDKNTVAFYYVPASGGVSAKYGVAVGYDKMATVQESKKFVAANLKGDGLATVVLFEDKGVMAEKDYAYVLGRSTTVAGGVTLNVVLMDGTASTLKISRNDWDSLFQGNSKAFNTVYSYTTDKDGFSDLTYGVDTATSNVESKDVHAMYGYAVKLRDGTVALYKDEKCTNRIDTYAYDSKTVYNVEGLDPETDAPKTDFGQSTVKEAVLILNAKEEQVRVAYVLKSISGTISGDDHSADWTIANATSVNSLAGAKYIQDLLDDGKNVKVTGDLALSDGNLVIPTGATLLVVGDLTESGGHVIANSGTLKVQGKWTTVAGQTTLGGSIVACDLVLGGAATITGDVTIKSETTTDGSVKSTNTGLTIAKSAKLYINEGLGNLNLGTGAFVNHGHFEWAGTVTAGSVLDDSLNSMVGNKVNASSITINGGSLEASKITANSIVVTSGSQVAVTGDVAATGGNVETISINGSNVSVGGNLKVDTLTQTGGSVGVSGDVTVGAGATITGGELNIDGTVNNASAPITVTGNGASLDAGAVSGTVKVEESANVTVDSAGKIENDGSGKVDVNDKTAETTLSGELGTGTYDGKVKIEAKGEGTTGVTLTSGATVTFNGTVSGLANLGIVDGATNVTVVFGSKAVIGDDEVTNFFYSNKIAPVAKKDLPGMSFTRDGDIFVAASTPDNAIVSEASYDVRYKDAYDAAGVAFVLDGDKITIKVDNAAMAAFIGKAQTPAEAAAAAESTPTDADYLKQMSGTTRPDYLWAGIQWAPPKGATAAKLNGTKVDSFGTGEGEEKLVYEFFAVAEGTKASNPVTPAADGAESKAEETYTYAPLAAGTKSWDIELTWTVGEGDAAQTVTETYTVTRIVK